VTNAARLGHDAAHGIHLGEINEAVAAAIPDREMMVWRDRRLSYAQGAERSRRLANYLRGRGLGVKRERSELAGWESGQDHVALYLYNGPEYIEGMLGAFKSRTAPFNVNYRYVDEELVYLLRDSHARAIVYHSCFAPTLARIRSSLPELEVLIQVEDGSGEARLPGAVDYEAALAGASPGQVDVRCSPDDLYILYTGGTTGMPKGVLWRQHDIFFAAMGGQLPGGMGTVNSVDEMVERARRGGMKTMPAAAADARRGALASFNGFHSGNTVVFQSVVDRLDPDDVLRTAEREKANAMLIVGDAFARPLIDQLRKASYDVSALFAVVSGGAALNAALKKELLELLPKISIIDAVGSSETGSQASNVSNQASGATTGTFTLGPGACVLSEDLSRMAAPGDASSAGSRRPGACRWATSATARERSARSGDRRRATGARRPRALAAGRNPRAARPRLGHDQLGRREDLRGGGRARAEVAPAVLDAVVCGRPSERWGNESSRSCACAKAARSASASPPECRRIARYKLPKAFLFRDEIVRSPSGKGRLPRWAEGAGYGRELAARA
jgi:fatty-acyl-CoA synthase